jgi:hypothetical protein
LASNACYQQALDANGDASFEIEAVPSAASSTQPRTFAVRQE